MPVLQHHSFILLYIPMSFLFLCHTRQTLVLSLRVHSDEETHSEFWTRFASLICCSSVFFFPPSACFPIFILFFCCLRQGLEIQIPFLFNTCMHRNHTASGRTRIGGCSFHRRKKKKGEVLLNYDWEGGHTIGYAQPPFHSKVFFVYLQWHCCIHKAQRLIFNVIIAEVIDSIDKLNITWWCDHDDTKWWPCMKMWNTLSEN